MSQAQEQLFDTKKPILRKGVVFTPVTQNVSSNVWITEGRKLITPEQAQIILDEMNYSRQRPIKPERLYRHISKIRRSQWDPDCLIRFCRLNGQLVLVDGQHRLTACVNTKTPIWVMVAITDVINEEEIHIIYSRIDEDGNRTVGDILKSRDPAPDLDILKSTLKAGYQAMKLLEEGFPHRKIPVGTASIVTKEDQVSALSPWLVELKIWDEIIISSQSNLRDGLRNQSVVAVALATLRHQRARATAFWTAVGKNELLKKGDPEQAFVNFLLGVRSKSSSESTPVLEYAYAASDAWNAYYKNRPLQVIRKTPRRPIIINGTPYKGHD